MTLANLEIYDEKFMNKVGRGQDCYLYTMFKARYLLFLFVFVSLHLFAQQPQFKVFLVGDAGEDELTGETLDSLKSKLKANPNSAVVFLGDNCYKRMLLGLAEGFKGFDSSKVAQEKMLSQLAILDGYHGWAYFVPGNHDWWNKTDFTVGKRKLKIEESFIEANLKNNKTIANPDSVFFPKDGSPGPVTAELNGGKLKIVFIDTDWPILLGFKTTPKANFDFAPTFYHRLDSVLADARQKNQVVMVVAHHPVYATGKVLSQKVKNPHLFGRIKQSFMDFPAYKTMSDSINAILQKHPGVYYASGHIHALQYHLHNGVYYLISGAGSKTNHVKAKDSQAPACNSQNCLQWNEKGFFEVDFYSDHQDIIMYHDEGRASEKLN